MKQSIFRQMLFVLGVLLGMSGCTNEDLDICYTPYQLQVGVSVASGQPDRQPVQSAVVYVFDSHTGMLLGQHPLSDQDISEKKVLQLDYINNNNLTAVYWGNANEALPAEVTTLSELKVALRMSGGYAVSPADLFFGTIDIDQEAEKNATRTIARELPIARMVSSMVIKTRKLKEWVGTTSNDFHYVVRRTQSVIGPGGQIEGALVSYRPQATFDDVARDFTTGVFNVLPSTEGNAIEVDICYGNAVVYTLKRDEKGQPIKAVRDKLLNIVIDFSAEVAVKATLTPWGEVDQTIMM